ncbi:unnamed protein product [Rhizophagus irregularis]|nr:unnamed protein product [Rhizophagus irregularis]CAB4418501.1 unnamed protein product [Rhizophagus irregularis]
MMFTENKPSTEPFSFIFLKKLCSFALVIILVFYTYNQFSQFSGSIDKPNINVRRQNSKKALSEIQNIKIIVRVCSLYPINCTYSNNECESNEYVERRNIPDCNNYYALNFQEKVEIKITPFITDIYFHGIVIDNKFYASLFNKSNSLYIVNDQINVIYYSFIISKRIVSDYVYGLAGGGEQEFADFFVYIDHIVSLNTLNATTLVLMPTSMDINYQEESYYDLSSIISNVGGFFSSLSGFYVLLFGATKLAPWGFLQTYVFSCLCTRYQRKLIRKLQIKYEPIPFVSGRTKNITLEERVQSIENILKEYYLDTDFLNLLLTKYNKIDDNNIDDNSIDDKV